MTLYQFNLLETDDRLEALWKNGQFIAARAQDEYHIVLYSMKSFFVEVYYHILLEKIVKHRTFCTHRLLESYVPNNLLDELFP